MFKCTKFKWALQFDSEESQNVTFFMAILDFFLFYPLKNTGREKKRKYTTKVDTFDSKGYKQKLEIFKKNHQ